MGSSFLQIPGGNNPRGGDQSSHSVAKHRHPRRKQNPGEPVPNRQSLFQFNQSLIVSRSPNVVAGFSSSPLLPESLLRRLWLLHFQSAPPLVVMSRTRFASKSPRR